MPLDKVLGRRAFIDRLPMMPLIFILLPPPYGMDHNWSSCFFTRKQLPYHAVVLIFLEFVPRGKHVLAEARLGKSVKVVYGMMVAFLEVPTVRRSITYVLSMFLFFSHCKFLSPPLLLSVVSTA